MKYLVSSLGWISHGKPILQELHEELVHVPAVRAMLQSIRNSFAENRRGICKIRHWNVS